MIWSAVITVIGLIGLYVVGNGDWWGWAINLGNQAIWITYAIVTVQYPFIVSALLYTYMNARNLRIAYRKAHA